MVTADELADQFKDLLDRCSFPAAGCAVVCAVSGGADSMALMALAVAAGCTVTAVHVDHGLRDGSAGEADLVELWASRFGAAFERVTIELEDGPNVEGRARIARYAALPDGVLTGHTADDQAETVLMFLMRGTGPEGLAGIDPARRPLLGLRRAETERVCRELGIEFVMDPTNDDPMFTRNRVRHELVPLMSNIAKRDVVPLLVRTAELQKGVVNVVARLAEDVDPTDARSLVAVDVSVAREALRAWWRAETGESYSPDAAAIERMMRVARGEATRADVAGGWSIARTAGRLRLSPPIRSFIRDVE